MLCVINSITFVKNKSLTSSEVVCFYCLFILCISIKKCAFALLSVFPFDFLNETMITQIILELKVNV